jgi:hypothetical protein
MRLRPHLKKNCAAVRPFIFLCSADATVEDSLALPHHNALIQAEVNLPDFIPIDIQGKFRQLT